MGVGVRVYLYIAVLIFWLDMLLAGSKNSLFVIAEDFLTICCSYCIRTHTIGPIKNLRYNRFDHTVRGLWPHGRNSKQHKLISLNNMPIPDRTFHKTSHNICEFRVNKHG